MAQWFKAIPSDSLMDGQARSFLLQGKALLMVRVLGQAKAWLDRCSHANKALGESCMEDSRLVCPEHGAAFNAATGAALSLPAVQSLVGYPVKEEGGWLYVEL
jgi:3-phenylpropionate/trans-cinnamate dioxygenase ferredoxin subunit